MISRKALYDISGIKFISKFSTLITSTNMILALLMLGFRACAETFLQGHVQHEWHMQRAATSSSYESCNTSRGAKVQEYVGF